jgi:hypothetical protein
MIGDLFKKSRKLQLGLVGLALICASCSSPENKPKHHVDPAPTIKEVFAGYSPEFLQHVIAQKYVKPCVELNYELFYEDSVRTLAIPRYDEKIDEIVLDSIGYSDTSSMFSTTLTDIHLHLKKDRTYCVYSPLSSPYRKAIAELMKVNVESDGYIFDEHLLIFTYPPIFDPAYPKAQDSIFNRVYYNLFEFDIRFGNMFRDYGVYTDTITGKIDAGPMLE